ncbi:MAG TPA: LysE family transporter [Spirochaetota bacterium]|nr:LysE family transporter [Spirochaetota bacterium]HOM10776.1 LysE family transporter [Spirochaetota bacterium]HPP50675.1 LysE family transporter [Spirochaetota bacterium]
MVTQLTLLEFSIITLTVSLSGVMAPGPMSAVTINHGTRSRLAGLMVATGHAIVELPVILALFFGIKLITQFTNITTYITLAGSIVLFILATLTLKSLRNNNTSVQSYTPMVDGIVLSAFNPYFYVWWLTIGLSLIQKAFVFGTVGLIIFSVLHLACDYIWLFVLSIISYAGASFIGKKFKIAVSIITVIMLYAFGIFFMYDALHAIVSQ